MVWDYNTKKYIIPRNTDKLSLSLSHTHTWIGQGGNNIKPIDLKLYISKVMLPHYV